MKNLFYLLIVLVFSSCATVRVSHDYERGTDFSQFKTYNYYSDLQSGLSELDERRLVAQLDDYLPQIGLTKSETPDVMIDFHSQETAQINNSNVGVGVGGGGGNVGGGITIGMPIGRSEVQRQIIFQIIDDGGKGLVWEAITESGYNPNSTPDRKDSQFKTIVEKAFSMYPPQQ
ncbi:DUF4136 domain-containing protein [Aegicerativicinus sediminis]|uniref:DUF4136 domain-containing protein n=1 Tax=Aegicerativicinus sediminis TaxID=2893202 RepID=UPI001E359AB2|nr:DUF4136 domain-containing protein [Aegicerativicinus sediminis]